MTHLFNYNWNLSDGYPAKGIEKHNLKVFGTFICGGGSTMGYKLAGYNHLGGVEIDKKMTEIYKVNHHPRYLYNEDLRDFVKRNDLPKELYNLDILDGSPPCSTFSMAGSREKAWGKEKQFAEGQKKQRLDDLFFTYIELAKKLQPKVVIAENVRGLIQGNAKLYVSKIFKAFKEAGYETQLFLLNASTMGVPQKRERVFFVSKRKDFNYPKLKLQFNENPILFKEILDENAERKSLSGVKIEYWNKCKIGGNGISKTGNTNGFMFRADFNSVCKTILSGNTPITMPNEPKEITNSEYSRIGSFPIDYNFKSVNPKYIIGMSVPPIMMAQIANQIYIQWLKNE